MKILFLCGSLELGKDGVGDYTRRLAGELIRMGNIVSIISLNDRNCEELSFLKQVSDGTEVPVMRISAKISQKIRFREARNYIAEFDPEWISLQYVPFSFNKKGLPIELAKYLSKIGEGRRWNIMFHELWVGMDKQVAIKYYLYGKVQQYIVKRIIHLLSPEVVYTQSSVYMLQLAKINVRAKKVPLFGNIAVVNDRKNEPTEKEISIVVFGSIHFGAKLNELTDWCLKNETQETKINIHFVGNNGSELNKWIETLKKKNILYTLHGRLEADEISRILSSSSFGLTTTPYLLIEKSGVVSAMIEHELPAVCIARDWQPDIIINEESLNLPVLKWKDTLTLEDILHFRVQYKNSLEIVAQKYISNF